MVAPDNVKYNSAGSQGSGAARAKKSRPKERLKRQLRLWALGFDVVKPVRGMVGDCIRNRILSFRKKSGGTLLMGDSRTGCEDGFVELGSRVCLGNGDDAERRSAGIDAGGVIPDH